MSIRAPIFFIKCLKIWEKIVFFQNFDKFERYADWLQRYLNIIKYMDSTEFVWSLSCRKLTKKEILLKSLIEFFTKMHNCPVAGSPYLEPCLSHSPFGRWNAELTRFGLKAMLIVDQFMKVPHYTEANCTFVQMSKKITQLPHCHVAKTSQ